jgi:precorrin-2 methylase
VGPGDPNLLTVAAVRAIESADTVAYPVAREGAVGMAASVAEPWIASGQRRLPLVFPMVAAAEPRRQAWRDAAMVMHRMSQEFGLTPAARAAWRGPATTDVDDGRLGALLSG